MSGSFPAGIAALNKGLASQFQQKPGPKSDTGSSDPTSNNRLTPAGCKVNLPPHEWSLPVPSQYLAGGLESTANKPEHAFRRSIMWFFNGSDSVSQGSTTGTTTTPSAPSGSGSSGSGTSAPNTTADNAWAFQFLWNPTDISISVDRNTDVTPTSADRFTTVSGMYPGQETVSFSITLDRTWDMACLRGLKDPSKATDYYKKGIRGDLIYNTGTQITDLMQLGTLADVEYLLKTINGEASGGSVWKNALGRTTADIGYLQPNVVAVQFGPSINSLSYVGWITNLQIAHSSFTEDMIPIKSTVQVSLACLAASTLSGAAQTTPPAPSTKAALPPLTSFFNIGGK